MEGREPRKPWGGLEAAAAVKVKIEPKRVSEQEVTFVAALLADPERRVARAVKVVARSQGWGALALRRKSVKTYIEKLSGKSFFAALKPARGFTRRKRGETMKVQREFQEYQDQAIARIEKGAVATVAETMVTLTRQMRATMMPFLKIRKTEAGDKYVDVDVADALELTPEMGHWIEEIEIYHLPSGITKHRIKLIDRLKATMNMARVLGLLDEKTPKEPPGEVWARLLQHLPPEVVKQLHMAYLRASAPPIDVEAS